MTRQFGARKNPLPLLPSVCSDGKHRVKRTCGLTTPKGPKRYGHIGHSARREAMEKLSNLTTFDAEGAQEWAQWQENQEEGGRKA